LLQAPVLTPAPQFTQDWVWCANSGHVFSLDLSISGCTAVIRFGREPPHNLSIAFHNRANAHFGKGDLDSAVADYDQAIQQDAGNAGAFANRGQAFAAKGDSARAIADYNEARLAPARASTFSHRADAFRIIGDNDRAIADYTAAIERGLNDALIFYNRGNTYGTRATPNARSPTSTRPSDAIHSTPRRSTAEASPITGSSTINKRLRI
jgi:tetratricopeptide (TPR) repeat protein